LVRKRNTFGGRNHQKETRQAPKKKDDRAVERKKHHIKKSGKCTKRKKERTVKCQGGYGNQRANNS